MNRTAQVELKSGRVEAPGAGEAYRDILVPGLYRYYKVEFNILLYMLIEPKGAHMVSISQPHPPFQADRGALSKANYVYIIECHRMS